MNRSFLPSKCLALLVLFAMLSGKEAHADDGDQARFHLSSVALLMPDALIGKRIAIDDIVSLTDSIVAETNVWAAGLDTTQPADDCTIFVAVRPGRRLKTWASCSSFDGKDLAAHITRAVDGKRVPTTKGLVLYSIYGKSADHQAFPEEWKAALDGKEAEVLISAIVDKVWPE